MIEEVKDKIDLKEEFVIQFHKEKRRNSVREKLRRLETLESKLTLNGKFDRSYYSKQSTNLFENNKFNPKFKQQRKDKFGLPIIRKGMHKVTFAENMPEIKVFNHKNTIFEDKLHEVNLVPIPKVPDSKDKVEKVVVKKPKYECQCACLVF